MGCGRGAKKTWQRDDFFPSVCGLWNYHSETVMVRPSTAPKEKLS